ncbi:MAG TPA: ribosomal protein S18-alanine N-acetyltransferase [Thermoanaerobaculia bacterium]|nr:ribosomal protein S18-alanine N-acetyltransferase [Thermoanaerobaculia bacterium]
MGDMHLSEITIRAVRLEDLDAVTSLERLSFPAPWRREFFEGELRAPGRFCLVAFDPKANLAGYVFAMHIFDEMHINKIAVSVESRRQGVATTLMARCIAFGKENEVTTMTLEVRESNRSAQRFYKSLSFEPVYSRPHYYPDGEGAIVMSSRL